MREIRLPSVVVLCAAAWCSAADPKDESVRLPVTRDTWLSNVGKEADGSNGGSPRMKLKSIQEMALLDIDPAPLKGKTIRSATLHVRADGKESLQRITVSSFAAEWAEGTGNSYAQQAGSSTFHNRKHPDTPWAYPGSDLTAVMCGQGGTVWRMADATPPDAQGWQRIPVDPAVVAARVAGVSHGFLLFDDTGTEWTRDGDKFTTKHFPNRFINSKDSNTKTAPYLTVAVGPADAAPPAAPTGLKAETAGLPAGEARVRWGTPADQGGAGTVGFLVDVNGKPAPRYLIPAAGKVGKPVLMRLRDLGLKPGEKADLSVRAVDGAGNVGPAAALSFPVSAEAAVVLAGQPGKPFTEAAPLPKIGEAEVAVLDALDKVHPVSGDTIPKQPAEYFAANHLWSAKEGRVRLHAAKNEIISFQIHFRGAVDKVEPKLTIAGVAGLQTSFGRYANIPTGAGPLPDPVVDLAGPYSVPTPEDNVAGQKNGSLLCELVVPHGAAAGDHAGTLTLSAAGKTLELKVTLRVWNFTLPDHLSFYPEMNAYSLPAGERAWYRLAHRHRTVLNAVPYTQSGNVRDGWAPAYKNGKLDWSAWDARFGPLFDGSAFADLPRKGVPHECFYLPLHENWPAAMEGGYNGHYWADRAFTPAYRKTFGDVSRSFAEHLTAKGWMDTNFQFFLNGKIDFKKNGWSRGSSPWLLDEPANFQDYWALRWFGEVFFEAVPRKTGQANLSYRCDISRPQWQRDTLDAVLDYNVVAGGPFLEYHRLVMDRKEDFGQQVVAYGGTNAPEGSNMQPVGWSLDTWSLGGDGVLPWLAVGTDAAWKKGVDTCVLYPGGPAGLKEPVPSIRLKAYLRGQQDVEYLTLLTQVLKRPRWAVGGAVRQELKLKAVRQSTGYAGEDAGVVVFDQLKPADAWALRVRVGEALSAAKPEPKRKLVDFRFPARDLNSVSPGYVGKQ